MDEHGIDDLVPTPFDKYQKTIPGGEATIEGYIRFASHNFDDTEKIQTKDIAKNIGAMVTDLDNGDDDVVAYAANSTSPRLQLWTLATYAEKKAAFLAEIGMIRKGVTNTNREAVKILELTSQKLPGSQPPPNAA